MADKELNLWQKISKIQNRSMEISKGGKNTFANYDYKRFKDIKKVVFELMDEYNVVLLPGLITPDEMNFHYSSREYKNKKGDLKTEHLISYYQKIEIINGDKPNEKQEFIFPFVGTNGDGLDKASGSAITYALKYLFNLWALIPDESLDPDDTEQSKKSSYQTKTTSNNKAITNVSNDLNYKQLAFKITQIEPYAKQELFKLVKDNNVAKPSELNQEILKEFVEKWESKMVKNETN